MDPGAQLFGAWHYGSSHARYSFGGQSMMAIVHMENPEGLSYTIAPEFSRHQGPRVPQDFVFEPFVQLQSFKHRGRLFTRLQVH